MSLSSHHETSTPRRPGRLWRVTGLLALAAVLALAFVGHLSPDMKLQWENLMALCGFWARLAQADDMCAVKHCGPLARTSPTAVHEILMSMTSAPADRSMRA